jgi:hypothetical protein
MHFYIISNIRGGYSKQSTHWGALRCHSLHFDRNPSPTSSLRCPAD